MGEEKKTSVIDELKNMGGLPWWLYLICAGVVLAVAFTDTLGYDATAFIAVTMALAIILYKIGKILPIWNTYIGGGLLMVFFGTAVLKQLNLIPEKYVDLINNTVQGAWKSDFYNKMYVNPEDAKEVYCSPAFAADEQLAKMPKTVVMYCDNDVFCDETEVFAERLLKLGVQVYARRFFNSNHGFTVQRKGEYKEAEQMILDALAVMK